MSTLKTVRCPYCVFEAPEVSSWLQHLGTVHANHPNFNVCCGVGGCLTTYRKYSSLKSHVYRQHRILIGLQDKGNNSTSSAPTLSESVPFCPSDAAESPVELTPITPSIRKRSEALLLLKLREVKHVTQSALDDTVSGYQLVFEEAVQQIKSQIQDSLQRDGVDDEIVERALSNSDAPKPFSGLETAYLQRKYYQQGLDMLVRSLQMYHAQHFVMFISFHIIGTNRSGTESGYLLHSPIRRKNPQSEMPKVIPVCFHR